MKWPELVGLTPEEAERKIEEMPRVQIQVVEANSLVTMDFNQGRVRLYLDPSGKVQTSKNWLKPACFHSKLYNYIIVLETEGA